MTTNFFERFVNDVETEIDRTPGRPVIADLRRAMVVLKADFAATTFGYYEAGFTPRECADALITAAAEDRLAAVPLAA